MNMNSLVTNAAPALTLAQHTDAIRVEGKRTVESVINIGRHLSEAREQCDHGEWLPWLKREFGWTERHARNFMSVYELDGKSENISDLNIPVSGLYLLAAPSTPGEAKTEVIERAEKGEKFSVTEVKEVIDQHAAPDVKASKTPTQFAHYAYRKDGRVDRVLERFQIAISSFCGGAWHLDPADIKFPPTLTRKMVADARESIKEAIAGLRKMDARLAAYSAPIPTAKNKNAAAHHTKRKAS
jgi:hypothetical protein